MFKGLIGRLFRKDDFLPEGRIVLEEAKERGNCFSYALALEEMIERWDFLDSLHEKGYEYIGGNNIKELVEGDIIAYYKIDPDINGFSHASVYVGNGRAVGVFGMNGELIEHPVETIPDNYFHKELGVLWNAYRKSS